MKPYLNYSSALILTAIGFASGQTPSDSRQAPGLGGSSARRQVVPSATVLAASPTSQPARDPAQTGNGAVVEINGDSGNASKLERARRIYDTIIRESAPIDQELQKDALDALGRLKMITPAMKPTTVDQVAKPGAPLSLKTNPPTTNPAAASGAVTVSTPGPQVQTSNSAGSAIRTSAKATPGAVPSNNGPATTPAGNPAVASTHVPVDARDLNRLALELRQEAAAIDALMVSSSHGMVWVAPEVEQRLIRLAHDLAPGARTAAK